MTPLVILAGLFSVLVVDQLTKWGLRRRLGGRSISLGLLGRVKVSEARVWLVRRQSSWSPRILWSVWSPCAAAIVALAHWFPASAGFAGILLGGSFSHLVESSWRGSVTDYIQLEFWPSFNMADVAMILGVCGLFVNVMWGVL